jgi:hypothetical protein
VDRPLYGLANRKSPPTQASNIADLKDAKALLDELSR